MPFLAYLAVLLVAAAGVLFGLDLVTAPLQGKPHAHVARQATTKLARRTPLWRGTARDDRDRNGLLSPVYPTSPGGTPKDVAAANSPLPVAQTTPLAVQPTAESTISQPEGAPPNAATTLAKDSCNIAACESAYRSFHKSDCTYQPYVGQRHYCDKDSGPDIPLATRG